MKQSKRDSSEVRERAVPMVFEHRTAVPPHNMTVAELAIEEGISDATLYNSRKSAREEGAILPSNSAVPDKWSSADKFPRSSPG